MILKPISAITIPPNRMRREFDEKGIRELAASIQSKGLLHPIVVRDDETTLVSGERRLRAISTLKTPFKCDGITVSDGWVPVNRLSELTPLELLEAEYEENAIRLDLSYQERCVAIAKLHALRTEQARERGERHTKAATVAELMARAPSTGDSTVVSDAILVAEHIADPEVAKAKTEKEALNIIRKKLEHQKNSVLASQFQAVKSPHTVILGDANIELARLPDATFDVICVDPPYGINAHKFDALSGSEAGTKHEYEDSPEYAHELWSNIFCDGARICKPQAHLYMFFDLRWWTNLQEIARGWKWDVWPRPIIWHKPSGGMLGDIAHGPRMSYECILFASRGNKRVTGTYLDVIIANPADTSLHAAAKPKDVIVNLLRRSCIPGDRVLDPCCGSGTIFDVAKELSLFATGIECVETHYNTALLKAKL